MHCLCLAGRWKRQAARFTQRLSPELPWRYHRNERRQAVSRPHKQISSDAVPVITGDICGDGARGGCQLVCAIGVVEPRRVHMRKGCSSRIEGRES